MGQTPSTQIQKKIVDSGRTNLNRIQSKGKAMVQAVNNNNIQGALQRGQDMVKAGLNNNIQGALQRGQDMVQAGLNNNIQGALQRGQDMGKAMGKATLNKIQNSNFVKGVNDKIQETKREVIQKVMDEMKKHKDNFKLETRVETLRDIGETLNNTRNPALSSVGVMINKKANSIEGESLNNTRNPALSSVGDMINKKANSIEGESLITFYGGGKRTKKHNRTKKYRKSKKHNRTKKHIKSKKHNRTKKHRKSKKHSRTKKKSRKR